MDTALQLFLGQLADAAGHGGGHKDRDGGHGGSGGDSDPGERFPNDPRNRRYDGPWLQQQLTLSITIGVLSFAAFCLLRRRSPALFAPRTKLKGFMPHARGIDDGIFAWVMPTLQAQEIKILHIVGLDAAVLLSFFKMGFWVFVYVGMWSCFVLMPVNFSDHGSIEGVAPSEDPEPPKQGCLSAMMRDEPSVPGPTLPWTWRVGLPSTYHFVHLLSTYLFTALVLRALYKGLGKFVRARQLYALDLLQSIPARTVEVTDLPSHLQREKDLAQYFESMGLAVESTVVVREVRGLKSVLAQRANALSALEREWCKWLGNPTDAENYDPDTVVEISQERSKILARGGEQLVLALSRGERDDENSRLLEDAESIPDPAKNIRAPKDRARPTMRLNSWNPLSPKVDALTLLETRYRALDRTVEKMRKRGAPPSNVGFVTFVDGMSAQIAAQAVHYPLPGMCTTKLAPEPRDIIWSNISIPLNERRMRQLIVWTFTIALFLFYIPPLAFLASLLSPKVIEKYLPGLAALLKKDERLRAFVETSLPSVAVISFNAILPLVLEWTAHLEGLKARSLVEYSVLKRYYIFLLTSVIFIFLVATTALGVIADLAGNPMRIIDKLAQSLPRARQFSLSYVIFQALAVLPLQLLQLPVLFGRFIGRLTAMTPRDYAELNAPPQLYAGSVYPAALIVFTLGILYSIVMPLITVFGALYFALAYFVYKYKLLFVYYRSYESRGQAWPLCSTRIVWALGLFQLFQLSLFSVRKQFLLSTLMLPLLAFTIWFGIHLSRTFGQLSEFVSLSSIAEVNRPSIDEGSQLASQLVQPAQTHLSPSPHIANTAASPGLGDRDGGRQKQSRNPILAMRDAALNTLDPDETVLSRKRYAAKDETLFVAKSDRHTDYREPPAGGYYYGVLNTGRRRYGHPALTGTLPEFWPPVRQEEDEESDSRKTGSAARAGDAQSAEGNGASRVRVGVSSRLRKLSKPGTALVLSLRRRKGSTPSNNNGVGSSLDRSPSAKMHRQTSAPAEHWRGKERSSFGKPGGPSPSMRNEETQGAKSRGLVTAGDGEDCDLPNHQHETSEDVWGQPTLQETPWAMQSAGQSSSLSEQLNVPHQDEPDAFIRPVRSVQDIQHNDSSTDDPANDEAGDEQDDDDDDDDFEGIYVHRTAHGYQATRSETTSGAR